MKKAEQDEIAQENDEINNLTKDLKKKQSTHKKLQQVYDQEYGNDHIEQLEKRAHKIKKIPSAEPHMDNDEEPEPMPIEEIKPSIKSKKSSHEN